MVIQLDHDTARAVVQVVAEMGLAGHDRADDLLSFDLS